MSDCEEIKSNCRSIFKYGSSETTIERYTAAWVRLINLLEKSNNYVTESPNDE